MTNQVWRPSRLGRATLVGARAHELITAPGYSGRVLAVVTNAVYLADRNDEIVWLAHDTGATGEPRLAAHGRSILVHTEEDATLAWAGLRVEMSFSVQDRRLSFDDGSGIELTDAAVWKPRPIEPVASPLLVGERVRALLAEIRSLDCGQSLGRALPIVDGPFPVGQDTGATNDRILFVALGAIRELALAVREHDLAHLTRAGRALVGLGPGLTPAGDDLLGGLLFSLYWLQGVRFMTPDWCEGGVRELLDYARSRTNRISYTLLSDHAHGQGAAPIHDLVAGLLAGERVAELLPVVARLVQIGSTSGWDLLTGVMIGLRATSQSPSGARNPIPPN